MPAAWLSIALESKDYAAVLSEIQTASLMGDARFFSRGPHLPITNMGYFKPPNDELVTETLCKGPRFC